MLARVVIEESMFDPEAFGNNISALLDFNTVGYAYGINHNGTAAVAEGTGGLYGTNLGIARNLAEENFALFRTDTRIEVASTSKIITTVAVLNLLQSQSDDLDAMLSTPIAEFLPADWIMGANVNGPDNFVTVRHLLTHTSGFYEGGPDDPGNPLGINFEMFSNNTFQNLRAMVAVGVPDPTVTLPDGRLGSTYSYSNVNFSLLAKMVPYMRQDVGRDFLDDISEQANELNSEAADVLFGGLYEEFVRDNILGPAGVVDASMSVQDPNPAKGYDFTDADELIPGLSQSDYTDLGGAFGWKLSAPDLARFLNEVRHGDTILTDAARGLMDNEDFLLGWEPSGSGTDPYVLAPKRTDEFGSYYTHGGYSGNQPGQFQAAQAFQSRIAVFPGNVEAALVLNNAADNLNLSYFEVLRTSYVNSWSGLVIEGDSSDNIFALRLNAEAPARVDVVVDGDTIASPPVDVLRFLQFRGLGGADTFIIEDLPEGTDLILDGGADDDTFNVGNPIWLSAFPYIAGNLTIIGGSGNDDSVDINDGNGSGLPYDYSITGIDSMDIAHHGSITASDYSPEKEFFYGGIEELVLWANNGPNQITVSGIANPMTIDIHAGDNHDTMLVADLAAGVTVNGYGGFGDDTMDLGKGNLGTVQGSVFFEGAGGADLLILDDSDSPATAGRDYLFNTASVTASGFSGVTYSTMVEQVRLEGSSGDDDVNVESLGADTNLELFGHDGNDVFIVARDSRNLDAVAGDVVIHGGDGYPRSFPPNMAVPEDDDQVYVRDDKNDATDSFTINLHQGNSLVGRLYKNGANPSELPPSVIYDQIERTELYAGRGDNIFSVLAAPRFNQMSVFAGLGNDQIDVESTPLNAAAMRIFGEGGEDSIRVIPNAQTLANLRSPLSVDGGFGVSGERDNLSVHDTLSANAAPYALGLSSLTRAGSAAIEFSRIEDLMVSLSSVANLMNISATAAGTAITVLGNSGNDTLNVSNLASSVTFIGGAGVNDRAFFAGTNSDDTISIAGDTMTMGAGSLTCLAERCEVDGLAGMDTFHVGNGDIDSIGSDTVLQGGDGNDFVIINDQNNVGDDVYTVTASQVTKTDFLLVYHSMESLRLNAGTGDNTINIDSTSPSTSIAVNAGAGGDTIHLSPTSKNLSLINGPVTVNGEQGEDNVILHEELFVLGGFFPYNITRSTVNRSFFGGLSFDTIERLRLNLGSGNNTVNVNEFNRDVVFSFNGNVGVDTFNVNVHPRLQDNGGRLIINGGGNVDRLNVTYASKPQVPTKPNLSHKKAAIPGAGTIGVEYPEALYLVYYEGVEDVKITKA